MKSKIMNNLIYFLKKLGTQKKIFLFCVIVLSVVMSVIMISFCIFTYPCVELEMSSTNSGENFSIFFMNENMEYFDEGHQVLDIIVTGKQKYCFYMPDKKMRFDILRFDFGNSEGTAQISDIVIKTFFTTKEIPVQYILNGAFSPDVGTVTVEGNTALIESIGIDPYIVLRNLDDIDSELHVERLVILLCIYILLIVISAIIIKYFKAVNEILGVIAKFILKNKWLIASCLLILAAIIRYFYKLDARPCFHDDEYQTFGVAYGYLKTGTFYKWNFQDNCISDVLYKRAWPYTILLASWIRVFGLSEISCRAMSALLGVIFIISCIYITKKLFGDVKITLITVIIILSDSTITSLFRFTRMYSLIMPLSLWMVYFAYKALMEKNHIKDNTENKLLIFIKNNFDFHVGYVFGTLLLLYFGSIVHVNSLALCLGILLFIFYKAFTSKERKYIIVAFTALLTIGLLILGVFSGEWFLKTPVLGRGIGALIKHAGWFVRIHIEYLQFILNEFGSEMLALLFIVLYILCTVRLICHGMNKEILDVLVYLGVIAFSTVVFFVFFTNRYYSSKYIVMLTPISAIVYAVGLIFAYRSKKNWGIVIGIIFCVCSLLNVSRNYNNTYTMAGRSNFLPAYKTISVYYDLEADIVPIAGINIRSYYCSQVVKNYVTANLKNDNSMDALIEFAEEYSEGIITSEKGKRGYFTQGAKLLLLKWSDHLSGEGVDDYNVEVSHYYFIDGQQMLNNVGDKIDKYDVRWNENEQSMKILVNLKSFEDNAELLCVKINMESDDGEKITRAFQLRLPEDKDNVYQYELPWNSLSKYNPVSIEIENSYAIYEDGMLQEYDE